jgi:hypothetical protein
MGDQTYFPIPCKQAVPILMVRHVIRSGDSTYYGRVMSVYMLNFSMTPIAMLPTGYLVDRFGVSATEMTAGIILSIIMLIFLGFRRRLFLPDSN